MGGDALMSLVWGMAITMAVSLVAIVLLEYRDRHVG